MKKSFLFLIWILFLFISIDGLSRNSVAMYPEIGKQCPNIILKNIKYYKTNQADINSFRGKWLVLDFWSIYCGSCIASFPSVNKSAIEFKENVQYMMIGVIDKNNQTEKTYARFRQKLNLIMPCSFDSTLYNKWDLAGLPYIVVIDDKGIVRAITVHLKAVDLKELLNGHSPNLSRAYRRHEERGKLPYDRKKPMFVDGNLSDSTGFLYRTLISRWNNKMPLIFPSYIDNETNEGRFEVLGTDLLSLYLFAYFGQSDFLKKDINFFQVPELEVKDSLPFNADFETGDNVFCYSLVMPKDQANKQKFMVTMQKDLEAFFGYSTRIENRKKPYWRIISTPAALNKLKTKGDSAYKKGSYEEVILNNMPLNEAFGIEFDDGLKVQDETGINRNVDIILGRVDINDFRTSLQKYGLDIIKGEKEMKVFVISDPGMSNEGN
jgi:thiol-disulfide isomerase/thioredoxin